MNPRASLATGAVLVVAAFFAGSATRAQEPDKGSKEKKIRELLELNGTADFARAQYAEVVDRFATTPNIPKRFVDEFRQETKAGDLLDLMVGVYGKNVGEDVVDSAIVFYKTPEGKKLAEVQGKLSKGMNEAVATWGLETTSKIFRKMAAEEEAAKKKAQPPEGEKK